MKSRCQTTIVVVCYMLLTLSAQIVWALSLRLPKRVDEGRQQRLVIGGKEPSRNWLVSFYLLKGGMHKPEE